MLFGGDVLGMGYRYPRKEIYSLKVGRTKAGLGLFAEEDIKKNAFVIEYFGSMLGNDAADEKGGKYLFTVDDKRVIDGSARENKARYLNHSCRPNCEVEIEGKRVFIYTLRKVKSGEELTYDYGKEYFNSFIKPYGCRCGHHRRRAS